MCPLLSGGVKTQIPAEFGTLRLIGRLFRSVWKGSEKQDLFAGVTQEGIHA